MAFSVYKVVRVGCQSVVGLFYRVKPLLTGYTFVNLHVHSRDYRDIR